MNVLVNLISVPADIWVYFAIDVGIAILLLAALRWISGRLSSVDTNEELCTQDNFAFGISIAGRMFALCVVLAAAVAGSTKTDYYIAAVSMLAYGLVGLVLIKVGRVLHDKLILDRLDKEAQIMDRNSSVAIIDAASAISTAIIIHSVMLWVEGTDTNALIAVCTSFIVTQAILLVTTRFYERQYRANNQGTMQKALTEGQLALALQQAGMIVGTSIVVSTSAKLLIYNPEAYVSNFTGWLVTGAWLAVLLAILVMVLKKLVLSGLNLVQEVDQQHNVGVACIEMALSVGIAFMVSGLIA
ncbi:DUF350 domain-containing protein [Aestuariibacter sp. AA17]|uniref:DUF350 domain-containing protein n=1 Tax=Fluctibacter corallii TaxID=2984329 RepID=A0ABT3ABJ6_9ALTE|nr:DUF350 domain-containing protein [Aestuariibacter sp. AA17]MCV2886058.1 DUF350 domain-containing protein [Aestuariibacter sp. AA17]